MTREPRVSIRQKSVRSSNNFCFLFVKLEKIVATAEKYTEEGADIPETIGPPKQNLVAHQRQEKWKKI